ncbi:nuclear transport factor 2 family protein [Rathayibacter caricis]|nr:nuclear transport factor 2 family protein [Rathayibacter caricis]
MTTSIERLLAEADITRLMHTYAHRLDGADFAGVGALFDQGVWHIAPDRSCHGSAEVEAWLVENLAVHGDKLGTRHIISNVLIDVADDGLSATALSYGVVTQVTEDFPIQVISQCRYEDIFACTASEWHFLERRALIDGFGDTRAHIRPTGH